MREVGENAAGRVGMRIKATSGGEPLLALAKGGSLAMVKAEWAG